MANRGYDLTEIQLRKLCYDIFIQLNPDKKTFTSFVEINKEWNLKVIYMNEDNTRVNSVMPPTIKQINTALAKLVSEQCTTKASKLGVANYMRSTNEYENPYADDVY